MATRAIERLGLLLILAVGVSRASGANGPRILIEVEGTDQSVEYGRLRADVRVIMPDGKHLIVTCLTGLRRCFALSPGPSYSAEVDGNALWIYGSELGGKEHRAKYAVTGNW